MHCTLSPFLSYFFTLSVCLSLSLSVCRWHFKLEGKLWLDLWRCLSLLSTINVYRTVRVSVSVKHILPLLLLCFMFLYLFALHVLLSLSFTHFFVHRFYRPATNRNFFFWSPPIAQAPTSRAPATSVWVKRENGKFTSVPFTRMHSPSLSLPLLLSVRG